MLLVWEMLEREAFVFASTVLCQLALLRRKGISRMTQYGIRSRKTPSSREPVPGESSDGELFFMIYDGNVFNLSAGVFIYIGNWTIELGDKPVFHFPSCGGNRDEETKCNKRSHSALELNSNILRQAQVLPRAGRYFAEEPQTSVVRPSFSPFSATRITSIDCLISSDQTTHPLTGQSCYLSLCPNRHGESSWAGFEDEWDRSHRGCGGDR